MPKKTKQTAKAGDIVDMPLGRMVVTPAGELISEAQFRRLTTRSQVPSIKDADLLKLVRQQWVPPSDADERALAELKAGSSKSRRRFLRDVRRKADALAKKLALAEADVLLAPPNSRKRRDLAKRIARMQAKLEALREQEERWRAVVEYWNDQAEVESWIYEDLEKKTRIMAKQGFAPGIISAVLGGRNFDFPGTATGEKALNARLFRARTVGFEQPVSPTAKRRRDKT